MTQNGKIIFETKNQSINQSTSTLEPKEKFRHGSFLKFMCWIVRDRESCRMITIRWRQKVSVPWCQFPRGGACRWRWKFPTCQTQSTTIYSSFDCWTVPDTFPASRGTDEQSKRQHQWKSSCWWCYREWDRPARHPSSHWADWIQSATGPSPPLDSSPPSLVFWIATRPRIRRPSANNGLGHFL